VVRGDKLGCRVAVLVIDVGAQRILARSRRDQGMGTDFIDGGFPSQDYGGTAQEVAGDAVVSVVGNGRGDVCGVWWGTKTKQPIEKIR
jgi:hypothetical protein